MKRLFDLRFVIGIFFTVIGLLLLVYGFTTSAQEGEAVNKWCGGIFVVFGVFMLVLSAGKPVKD